MPRAEINNLVLVEKCWGNVENGEVVRYSTSKEERASTLLVLDIKHSPELGVTKAVLGSHPDTSLIRVAVEDSMSTVSIINQPLKESYNDNYDF